MNTIKIHCRCRALMLMLLALLPLKGLAQATKFEMVVEMTDGTERTFLITEDYPQLRYQYGGEDGVNRIDIHTEDGFNTIFCPDIKRLYTRPKGSSGISNMSVGEKSSDIYDIQGRRIGSSTRSLDHLPKGVYIVNGRKVIK